MDTGPARKSGNTRGFLSRWPYFRALGQSATQVAVRRPGRRFLSAPCPMTTFAIEDREFAWLAAAAYRKTPAAARRRSRTADAEEQIDPEGPLRLAGWEPWTGFPTDELERRIAKTHLRVEVWQKTRQDQSRVIAVTFGGTVFDNEMDWRANLRWFLPGKKGDQYSEVVHCFAPAFLAEFTRRFTPGDTPVEPERARHAAVELYVTGHSLGGGLAQQFAYAHCLSVQVPRVSKVYAFDPSPVTGFFSVEKRVRDVNKKKLEIDRIYERGEILSIVRSITSAIITPRATAPAIRGLRYFLFFSWNPIVGHSMVRMATKMDAAAHGHRP